MSCHCSELRLKTHQHNSKSCHVISCHCSELRLKTHQHNLLPWQPIPFTPFSHHKVLQNVMSFSQKCCWGFKTFEMWHCCWVSGWFPVILQYADTYRPSDIVSHTTTLESSNFLLVPSLPVPNSLERPTRTRHYFIYHWSTYSPLMRLKTWKECDMA
jgi:hypothetical protein